MSQTFGVAEADVGFDLDGDDDVDNSLGSVQAVRTILSNEFETAIATGSLLTLTELRGLDDIADDDPDVTVVIFGGTDADGDSTDNFVGDETFTYQQTYVRNVDCDPVAQASGAYSAGEVVTTGDDIKFFVTALGGFLEILDTRVTATIEAHTAGFKTVADVRALVGGTITGCSLARPAPDLPFGAMSAQQVLLILAVQPDIDVDGDGLETLVGGLGGIEMCIDGDGTEIPGQTCGCDPRMRDGYSVTFETDIVGAVITGPDPT